MFFDKALGELDEAAIQALVDTGSEEGLRLEFKEQLNLGNKGEKREAAKDVSALANAVGGRIVYGISETKAPDGRTIAGGVKALVDALAAERLADVLVNAIHPRPVFALKTVPLASGGTVLVVEVYRSETDLHMVTGYSESRFYKRGAKGNVLMTEPEVREAYAQIAATRTTLDSGLAEVVNSELDLRSATDESIVIAPWHASPTFFDPRTFQGFEFQDIASRALLGTDFWECAQEMTLFGGGYRVVAGNGGDAQAVLYLAALKTGVLHFSYNNSLPWRNEETRDSQKYFASQAIVRLVATMRFAEALYGALNYQGRSRLWYVLRPQKPWLIEPVGPWLPDPLNPAQFRAIPRDFFFGELGGRYGGVIKEIVDEVFQLRGEKTSPYFSPEGKLLEYGKKLITPKLIGHLE